MGRASSCLVALAAAACRSPAAPPPDGLRTGGTPTLVPGAPDRILLTGMVVTPDQAFDGQVLVEGARITCVAPGTACASEAGADGATLIDTQGVIAPGMIDVHNHILFDIFDNDDWLPSQLYTNHTQWTAEPRYAAMLDVKQCLAADPQGQPAWCAQTPYGTSAGSLRCELDKWGELKALVAGTTGVIDLAGTTSACFGSLARSLDTPQNALGQDLIQATALFPPSNPDGVCANFATGKTAAFVVHVGEGTDGVAGGELAKLGAITTTPNCLFAPQTAITHGVAFTPADFAMMGQAGMKLVWSPQSNVSLYGATADIPAALAAGVTVALGPDWSMGGSANMLDELRFADAWDNAHWNDRLSPQDLVTMATAHGAQALALADQLGTLAPGKLADLAVYAGDPARPYDAILAARPANVELVMVGGTALYGDGALSAAGPAAPGCEMIDICGTPKFLCAATTTTTSKLDQTSAQIAAVLSQALADADALTPGDGFTFSPLAPLAACK